MNKQKIPPLVICIALLTSCASSPDQGAEVAKKPVAAENSQALVGQPDKEEISPSTLPPELLYQLLTAEIAGQKGLHTQALDGYLGAAKQSRDPRVAERAAQIALYLKDDAKALEAAKLWRVRDPENMSAMKVAMMFQVKSGQFDQAYQQLLALQARSTEDEFGRVLLDVVKVLAAQEQTQEVLALMTRLSEAFPDKSRVHYAQAVLALQKKSPGVALQAISKALQLKPEWKQAIILKAQIVADEGNLDQAEALLLNALKTQPESINLRMVYTQLLVKSKKLSEAEIQFQKIIENDPENHDAYFTLAMVQLQLEKPEEAKQSLQALLDAPNWRERAAYYLGRLEADQEHYQQALGWFESIGKGPMALDAQINAALMLMKLKQQTQALDKLNAAQKQFPKAVQRIYLIKAEIYSQGENLQAAYDILTQGLRESPKQVDLLYSRALIAERMGQMEQLEADLHLVLKQQPDNVNALNALGYTLADKTERLDESRRYLDRAIKLRPDDAVILDSYGWLQFRLKDLQKAEDYLRQAYEKDQDAEIASHLGEVLWVIGKRSEAIKIWQTADETQPQNRHIETIKKRFDLSF